MLASYVARLGLTTLGSLTRPHAGVLDDVRLPMHVWPGDIDTYGHVNNGRYLTLMDMGRLEWGLRTGIGREILKRRWSPVAGAATIRFRRELKAFWRFPPSRITARKSFQASLSKNCIGFRKRTLRQFRLGVGSQTRIARMVRVSANI